MDDGPAAGPSSHRRNRDCAEPARGRAIFGACRRQGGVQSGICPDTWKRPRFWQSHEDYCRQRA